LPSRSVVAGPPATTYDVYEVKKDSAAGNVSPAMLAPLTPAPLGTLEFSQPITLGAERCFVVRPVDILAGVHVRGPASPVACASFADTFAPAPAGRLDTAATAGRISLIWEASPAEDLAGYIVLRGEGADATLTPLNPKPIAETTYTDDSVKPGVQYTFAVVAVDKAGNRSTESNRVQETAR
jgi:fibronectin type 3 domain-containing protein